MNATPDPAAPSGEQAPTPTRRDVEVRVRRAPKYGVFMWLGVILGAIGAWMFASLMPQGVNAEGVEVDTSPVLGFSMVVGAAVGLALGGVVALIVDKALERRARTVVAEQTEVAAIEPEAEPGAEPEVDTEVGPEADPDVESDVEPGAQVRAEPAAAHEPDDDSPERQT